MYDKALLQRYRKALDTAVKIATVYNVQPIKGRTVIICSMDPRTQTPCSAARGLGKPRTVSLQSLTSYLPSKVEMKSCLHSKYFSISLIIMIEACLHVHILLSVLLPSCMCVCYIREKVIELITFFQKLTRGLIEAPLECHRVEA